MIKWWGRTHFANCAEQISLNPNLMFWYFRAKSFNQTLLPSFNRTIITLNECKAHSNTQVNGTFSVSASSRLVAIQLWLNSKCSPTPTPLWTSVHKWNVRLCKWYLWNFMCIQRHTHSHTNQVASYINQSEWNLSLNLDLKRILWFSYLCGVYISKLDGSSWLMDTCLWLLNGYSPFSNFHRFQYFMPNELRKYTFCTLK